MNDPASSSAKRLEAAWKKFTSRVNAVRAKTQSLLTSVDEKKREGEISDLRTKIKQQ